MLELIVKRARALVDANAVLLMLREGDALVLAAAAGHVLDASDLRLPIDKSTSGQVLERGPVRTDQRRHPALAHRRRRSRCARRPHGTDVPMAHRGDTLGVLAAFDHGSDHGASSEEDEQLLRTFAATGANAVAIARSVESDRLRSALNAADAERRRWARELHDETLQGLGGLRVLHGSVL